MSLTIGIDGYNLAMPRGTGVATYGVALAEAVAAMGHRTEGVFGLDVGKAPATRELHFFDRFGKSAVRIETRRQKQRRIIGEILRSVLPVRAIDVPMTAAIEKQRFAGILPPFDRIVTSPRLFDLAHRHLRVFNRFLTLRMASPPDIMHWTYPLPVRIAGAKNIYTIHDLVPLRLPFATMDNKDFHYRLIDGCLRYGDHVCTVSEASRDDILSRFPIPPGRVTNTYQTAPLPAGTLARNPYDDARMIENVLGLHHRGYFLFFGALDPKKNIQRIIEAYLTAQTATPLVFVGARNWGAEQETKLFGSGVSLYGHDVGDRIVRLEYLPRDMLVRLIRGARAVLFPSLYEGFGLPALEAILLGTPVISSNISSLPEVVGDAGLLVDPYDVQAIADAILALDRDPELCARLRTAGPVQAAKFSEAAYQARLAAMYDRVMADGS